MLRVWTLSCRCATENLSTTPFEPAFPTSLETIFSKPLEGFFAAPLGGSFTAPLEGFFTEPLQDFFATPLKLSLEEKFLTVLTQEENFLCSISLSPEEGYSTSKAFLFAPSNYL